MRSLKKLGVLAVSVFVLSALSAPNATAAYFTWKVAGKIGGQATTPHVLTVNGGRIKCNAAETWGEVVEWNPLTKQHLTTTYRQCTAFGFPAHLSPGTYLFTPSGEAHLKSTLTIQVTMIFGVTCHVSVGPQTLKPVSYTSGWTFNVSNIVYTSSGGVCGPSGSNGTFTGSNEILGLSHDP